MPTIDEIKSSMRSTWMAGDFGVIAKTISGAAGEFIARLALPAGTRVLDVACGTGNTALPLARSGCHVTGVDIAPNLLVQARALAAAEGLTIAFDEGDAEALPYPDAGFDAVTTMFGAMFAPRPEQVASELARVLKPGGTLAMANWNPASFSGQMFKVGGKHAPPPPGIAPPVLWGDEATVRDRLSSQFADIQTQLIPIDFDLPMDPAGCVAFFRQYFGPTPGRFLAPRPRRSSRIGSRSRIPLVRCQRRPRPGLAYTHPQPVPASHGHPEMIGLPMNLAITASTFSLAALLLSCAPTPAPAPASAPAQTSDNALQTIDNPGGGQVVYGTIGNQHSPQSAMAFMLSQVHGHFGDRPQVSNVFQVRNTTTYAAFFTLIAKTQGNKAIAGEVIVSMPAGGQPVAAVLSDDAQNFTHSQPVLLQKLDAAWHSSNAAPTTASANSTGGLPPMHRVTAGDRSVYINLPDGWKLLSVAGGSVTAQGPKGERLGLGLMVQGIRNPGVRDQFAGLRGGAAPVTYPFGGDLFTAYVSIVNQTRHNQNLPPATFQLTKSIPLGGGAIEAHFNVDLHDGFGTRTATARISEIGSPGAATYAMGMSSSSLPNTVAAAETPTLMAIIQSASQDQRVVQGEQRQVMANIQAAGARANAQAAAADQRREASAAAFDASMDNIDRQSKAMQNYTLDRSQIQDNDVNGRSTVSNGLADALVRTDPHPLSGRSAVSLPQRRRLLKHLGILLPLVSVSS